ncbi:MAG: ABC transporter ATP-binding protein [Pseudomonadota bacterium]
MFRVFENLVDPFQPFEAKTPPKDLWAYYRSLLGPIKPWLPWIMGTTLLVSLMEAAIIFYSGRLIDLMGASTPAEFWANHSLEIIGIVVFVVALRPALIGLNRLFLEQVLVGTLQEQTRWRAHKHMLGQSVSFFQNDFAGRLSNRVMQQGPAVEDSIYMMIEGLWYSLVYVVGATLALSTMHPALAVPMVVWVGAYILYTRYIAVRVAHASEKWSDGRSLVTGRVVDAYANIETVKLFASATREEGYVLSAMRRLRLRMLRFLRLMTELAVGQNVLNGLLIVGVVGVAVGLWTQGLVSVGEVAAASALTIRLNGMSGWIMWVTIRLFEHFGVIREGLRSIAVPHGVVDARGAPALKVESADIAFEGLRHHYGRTHGGLDGVDLVIPAGQKVGLVGRSGAGKSSLVNLMLRLRDAESGRVMIDGQDVAAVTQDSLRAQIGVVTQDNALLHRSIRANILYGRPDAGEAEVIRAAERAEAMSFIPDLADPQGRTGLNAHVGERGVKLSGGQRQRIALARVILKDAPILVLDEATSALDSEVEAAILKTMYAVMEGKTVIAIAHRLSTIAQMDRIIVMEAGRIVEDGTHDDLIAAKGLYAGFWARQSGGFLDVAAE